MPRFHAQIPTPRASRNMPLLCKHFAHKADMRADGRHAQVEFTFGQRRMLGESGLLPIGCQAVAGEAGKRLRFVIDDHPQRFSCVEALRVGWQDGPLPSFDGQTPA